MKLNLRQAIGTAIAEKKKPEIHVERHDVIASAVKINYPKTKKYAQSASMFVKAIKAFLPSLDVLEQAADKYNASALEIPERDAEYARTLKSNLDIPFLIQTLTPIANSLPAGELLLKLLESLNSKQEVKQ